jgi:hypothetical protein
LVYFAEKDSVEKWSFFDSFWWGLMVLTTVGYGSTAPSTAAGKVWHNQAFIFVICAKPEPQGAVSFWWRLREQASSFMLIDRFCKISQIVTVSNFSIHVHSQSFTILKKIIK